MICNQHCQNWQVDTSGGLSFSSIFFLPGLNPLCFSFEDLKDLKERCCLSFCVFPFLLYEDHSLRYHLITCLLQNLSSSWGRQFIVMWWFRIIFIKGQRDVWILGCPMSALLTPGSHQRRFISGVPGLLSWGKDLWQWTLTEHFSLSDTMLNSQLLTWSSS